MDTRIKRVHARHLIDCKCRGLLEVDITTVSGAVGRASAPTGTSVGSNEAFVMRDNTSRFMGASVYNAVDIVNHVIAPAIIGLDVCDQAKVDETLLQLDGTPLKTHLGGNSIYSVSAACAMAAANASGMPLHHYWKQCDPEFLPMPVCNMFNGGKYRDHKVEIQEFGVIPYGTADMQEAVEMEITLFAEVGKAISRHQNGAAPEIANYFGHMPVSDDPADLFDIIAEAADRLNYTNKICYSMDCAATEFYNSERKTYNYIGKERDRDEYLSKIEEITKNHLFYFIEDILDENDFEGFAYAAKIMPDIRMVGDDLTCTNVDRLERALELGAVEGMILKPNQVGTVSQCFNTYRYAIEHDVMVIPSVRAGGTIDDPVKDMAIAILAPFCKCGAPRSGERISFLNSLLRASDEFPHARFQPIFNLKRAHV